MNQADEWISAEFQRLAEILYDYDHNLVLEMVPREHWDDLVDKTKIFRVVDTSRNHVVLYASAITDPTEILTRVWSMDQTYSKVVHVLDARNRAIEAMQIKKRDDELEAQKDLVLFIAKNTKSSWRYEGRVKDEHFRDKGPIRKVIL